MQIALKIRQDLITNLNFVRLTSSLMPPDSGAGIFNSIVKASFDETVNFINHANEEEFIQIGPKILNAIEPILQTSIKNFPNKKELREISASFIKLLKEEPDLFSFGIPFYWLDEHIETSVALPPDTPYHARIGTGYHAGKWSLEEKYFLDDGFFLLIKAEKNLEFLLLLGEKIKNTIEKGYLSEKAYFQARSINLNVCSYARNSIVNLYSFIECFVNSVGFDFYLRNKNELAAQEIEILQGKKKGRHLSIEYKLEKFPSIIRQDKKQIIFVTDPQQIQEPFLTFLGECKEIRDASMHYSPKKEAIWRKPTDWVEKATRYSKTIIEIAQIFWKACYPYKEFPFYLSELNYQKSYENAMQRYTETRELKSTFKN
jgi:hypothetical protein